MLEHAKQFLSTVLPPVPTDGSAFLNIHWSGIGNGGKKFWDGRACSSVAEAIRTINWVNGHSDGKDIYACMSLQSQREEKTSGAGNTYYKALRLAEHTVALRSIYIDIDVKEEGGYPDTAAALQALQSFLAATSLPMPSVCVASGSGGFHVHWSFERDLTPAEWTPLAHALAGATKHHGLKCDSQCTVDMVRILRVPETMNRKSDPANPVTLLSLGALVSVEAVREALRPYEGLLPAAVTSAAVPRIAANDELGAGLETSEAPPIKLEELAKNCPFVAGQVASGGEHTPQPLWFMAGVISANLEDGSDALHIMSSRHPGYSYADTEDLYQRCKRTKETRDIGWPSCGKIAGAGAKECASCPLLKQGKSPFNFAAEETKRAVETADKTLPDRYVRLQDDKIGVRIVNDDGTVTTLPIFDYPIIRGWLSNNPWTFHFITVTRKRQVTISVPTEVISAGLDSFKKHMGQCGVFCPDGQYKILKEFFMSWVRKLQESKDGVISTAPFGWSIVDGKVEGFSYAGRVWMPNDDDRPAVTASPVLQQQYTPRGDIQTWRELAKIITDQKRPALDAILAVAFAGPLVRFTGFSGLLLNAYSSESGIGKTTTMKVSQSVWGHPVLGMQALNDTSNSVLKKMGDLRSVPVYWDEIKSEQQTSRFVSIVFDLTGGREKTRMNSDMSLRLSGTWQTMMVSASNDSIIDAMSREVGSTTAGLHRMFEYEVPPPAQVTHRTSEVQRLTGRLDDNYGNAGLIYSKFIGRHWARVEAEVADMHDRLCTEAGVPTEERHWAATMAVLLKGAEYANELGLLELDIDRLRNFLFTVLARMRSEVATSTSDVNNNSSVSAVLAEFFNSTRSRNMLITNKVHAGRGKPVKGDIVIACDVTRLGEITVQVGRDDKIIRISSTFFSRWCAERGYSRHALTKKLEAEFGMKNIAGKLGGGTDLTCAQERLLEFDGNDPLFASFVDV